ncbi:universal stress protein [Actinokineospora enzanensis]|uniref:universal stress protein n=1 Tax=Actinokineospora enzanensis TaxID=155975 RepID=UPI00037BFE80|nr:universal stress protein [Actinokineospora enzanensis]
MIGDHLTVGVDGSPAGMAALGWALAEGARSGYRVHVVTVGRADEPDAELDTAVAAAVAAHPRASVWRRRLPGSPGPELVRVSFDSALLVVGVRRAGHALLTLRGSVSAYCARHACCPVVVVPADSRTMTSPATPLSGAAR